MTNINKSYLAMVTLVTLGLYSLNLTGDPGGKTGFFGNTVSSSCRNCHSSGAGGSSSLSLNIPSQGFTPGQTYQGVLTVSKAGAALFGLNLAAQNSGNTTMGTIASSNTRSQVLQSQLTHRRNGGRFNDSCQFSFSWTAPANATGPVTFKWNGLSANNDGFDTGDFTSNGSQTFALAPNAVEDLSSALFQIYPNPTTDFIHIKRFQSENSESVEIVSLDGKLIYRTFMSSGTDSLQISTQGWTKGFYLMKFKSQSQKFEIR